jgi:hypothetical protein
MFVSGHFTRDALGPLYDQVLQAIDADPLGHLSAFGRLYLATPDRRSMTELPLASIIHRVARTHPVQAAAAARALDQRMASLARAQEAEVAEATGSDRRSELERQRRQLERQRDGLARIAAGHP